MALFGIFGAGGFGREVMPLARSALSARGESCGMQLVFVVDDVTCSEVNGHRVISTEEFLSTPGDRRFNVAIGDGNARKAVAERLEASGAWPFSIIAPSAVVMDGNDIGEGAILCPFVTVTSNARIGRYFHANLYSYVAHDCAIGDYVTFAPQAACNGNVLIDDLAYIGTGAVIRQGRQGHPTRIGAGAVIGMGAIVTRDVDPCVTVVGNPAKPMLPRG